MKSTILQSKALVLVIMLLFCVNIIKAQDGSKWKLVGPDNVGGAVRAVLYDKADKSGFTMYGGATNGGLLKGLTTKDGTSWSRVPFTVDGELVSLNISCMFQAEDNTIYIGTGSIEDTLRGYPVYGKGLYTYKDGKGAFVQGTKPSLTNEDWKFITSMQLADGKLWVATNNGLRYQDENGNWAYAKGDLRVVGSDGKYVLDENGNYVYEQGEIIGNATEVKVVGNTVLAYINDLFYIGTTKGDDFRLNEAMSKKVTNVSSNKVYPAPGFMKFAVGNKNSNLVYAMRIYPFGYQKASQSLGIQLNAIRYAFYISNDGGKVWNVIIEGSSETFSPYFATPTVPNSSYPNNFNWTMSSSVDAVFSVMPDSDDKLIFGFRTLGIGERSEPGSDTNFTFSWPGPISINTNLTNYSPFYLHELTYSMAINPHKNEFLIGTAGGVYSAVNGANSDAVVVFQNVNRGIDVTDFNAISVTSDGSILGGTQNNSLQYFDKSEDMGSSAREFYGYYTNNLSYVASTFRMSSMFNNVMFVKNISESTGMPALMRTETKGEDYSTVPIFPNDSIPGSLPTSIDIWESVNDYGSIDSVSFVTLINYKKGDSIWIESSSQKFPISYKFTEDCGIGETIKVQDIVSSKGFFTWSKDAKSFNLYMVRGVDNFKLTPAKIKIGVFSFDNYGFDFGVVSKTALSKNGNTLYMMTSKGVLVRMSNLSHVYDVNSAVYKSTDFLLKIATDFDQQTYGVYGKDVYVTSMCIDPTKEERVIITFNKPITFNGAQGVSNIFICDNTFVLNPQFIAINGVESESLLSTMFYINPSNITSTNSLMLGTTTGLISVSDITEPNIDWSNKDKVIGNVPVTDIKQQLMVRDEIKYVSGSPIAPKPQVWPAITNSYDVYVSTYGNGIYTMASTKSSTGVFEEYNSKTNNDKLIIYPNPVNNYLETEIDPNLEIVKVSLVGMSGNLIDLSSLNTSNDGKLRVDVGNIPSGIYMLQVITSDGVYTGKIIKK